MSDSQIIACPNCNQLNRIPKDKLGTEGKCGSCKNSLSHNAVIDLDQTAFTRHASKSDIPILVDFWAPWCGPCKMMAPILEDAAKKLSPNIRVGKVNTEAEQTLASQFNIRSIPTLAIFHKGKEIDRASGAMPLEQLIQWTNNALKKAQ